MRRRRADANPIDVVEAAYELDLDDRAWLRNLTQVLFPLVDGGHGVTAYLFDMATPMTEWLRDEVTIDLPPDRLPIQRAFQLSNSGGRSEAMHVDPEPLGALIEATREAGLGDLSADPVVMEHFRRMGVRDYVALRTIEAGGKGICVNAGQREERHFDRKTRKLWARVAAHIAAGRRLRESLATHPDADADAVLTPSGRVAHAEGELRSATARAALREAVSRQELARGRLRRDDPAQATEAWVALVSGRWSLVDRYERGGRRYLVARRNAHDLPDPRGLTGRERAVVHLAVLGKSNKLIAYELGVSPSTVATYLTSAMRKLGTSSRVELIQLARQLAGH